MQDTIYSRHRPLSLLAALILFQVLLLAFQIKRENNVRLVRYWAVQTLTPVERAGTWTFSKISGVWHGYVGLKGTRVQNESLQKELDQLRMRNRELESQAGEGRRLAVLLNFRESHPEAQMVAAEVIGASADPTSHTLFINRGERDHIRRNLAVITPEGVVGKIVEVFPSTSQVLLINDKDSGVGALFATSRTHGVVKGSGDPNPRMDYIVNEEKVQAGDKILTSGEDHIFPKDLPIGAVETAKPGNPFQSISIDPAARLDRLEEVLILMSQQELTPKKVEEPAATSGASAGVSSSTASSTASGTPSGSAQSSSSGVPAGSNSGNTSGARPAAPRR